MTELGGENLYRQPLFQEAVIRPAYPWVTPLTLGLLSVYWMDMEPDMIYLVDVGLFNYIYVYDRESAGGRHKLFWKLNMANIPELLAEFAPRKQEVVVAISGVPSFDPQFGGSGAWVTLDYTIRVIAKIDRASVALVRHAVNPLQSVFNAVRRAAREILPYTSYKDNLLALVEDALCKQVSADPRLQATGFIVDDVKIEAVEGSERLAEPLQQSFNRMLHARDRREIALLFAQIDEQHFRTMAEADDPRGELDLEKARRDLQRRAAEQMVQALLVTGRLPPLPALHAMAEIAQSLGPSSLAGAVVEVLSDQVDGSDKHCPPAPKLTILRLDIASPDRVSLGHSFVLAVTIRRLYSPQLDSPDLPRKESGKLQVNWPEEEPYVRLRLEVKAPECKIVGPPNQQARLFRECDSPEYCFSLT